MSKQKCARLGVEKAPGESALSRCESTSWGQRFFSIVDVSESGENLHYSVTMNGKEFGLSAWLPGMSSLLQSGNSESYVRRPDVGRVCRSGEVTDYFLEFSQGCL